MAIINPNKYKVFQKYFLEPVNASHKQYEALRAFFCENKTAAEVADRFGYTISAFYSLVRDFKQNLISRKFEELYFKNKKPGPKEKDTEGKIRQMIVTLRKQYLSVPEIKTQLDAHEYNVSQRYVSLIIKQEGFARLPKRDTESIQASQANAVKQIKAPKSEKITFEPEIFSTQNTGILCLLPYIRKYGVDKIINESLYPETKAIDRLGTILSFIGLKISNIRRYNADDIWCMDRGLGLFAGLNVLPKTSWYSSYSYRVTREMNIDFLRKLHEVWKNNELLSDTMNLDFTAIPYWGNDDHLENNWSGKRHQALASMLAVLAQDPDSGIIDYGDVNVRHKGQPEVVLEFLDFYRGTNKKDTSLKYLVFDNRFTTNHNLNKLNDKNIKFVTIRRRGKKIVSRLEQLPASQWTKIRVMKADGKGRTLKVFEEKVTMSDYDKSIRQIAITGHGKNKPALLITNDFDISTEKLIRKYSRRWLVEKEISEQIEFFHLNKVSSSIVIKVDFDFTMTILAHNLYRLFAYDLPGYSHQTDITIFEKFLYNSGQIEISSDVVHVILKKKRHLPLLLTEMNKFTEQRYPWFGNRRLIFSGDSTT